MQNLLNNDVAFSNPVQGEVEPTVCTITSPGGSVLAEFQFQHGPLADLDDTNGVVIEDLLTATINRLRVLNEKHSCRENSIALTHLETAELWLGKRTADRRARGVEGTNQP